MLVGVYIRVLDIISTVHRVNHSSIDSFLSDGVAKWESLMNSRIASIKMTATVLGWHQLVSLLFLLLTVPGIQLGASATSDCTSGFISLDRLVGLARFSLTSNKQIIFPNINFTCNGTITEVTFPAVRYSGNGRSDLQVWRRNKADGVYIRVGGTPLSVESSGSQSGIYVHTLDSPLEFQTGDVFGIFQPGSHLRVVFQTNSGPESLFVDTGRAEVPPDTFSSLNTSFDYPLVAITADQQECVSGSASIERFETLTSAFLVRQTLNNRQSVSPQIKFTCDGNITKWIVGANYPNGNDLYPELQVWRRVNESIPNSYCRVGNTVIAVAEKNSDSHVYEYPVDPPLPVEAGDVLGIYQPPGDDSRLRVLYERDAGPVTFYQTPRSEGDFPEPAGGTVLSHSSLPLVTVEMDPMTSAIAVSTSPVVTETPGGGVDMPTSFPATVLGAGVAVGLVVAIVTLGAVMMVMVLVHYHKKGKYSLKESTAGDAEEMKSSEACGGFPCNPSMVENEAYGTAESAQPIESHGNDAYQKAAEAIATEQNEAYSGRVEGIDRTHTTTVKYEEISSPEYEYDDIEGMKNSKVCVESPSNPSMVENEAYGTAESAQAMEIHGNNAYQAAAETIATEQNEAYSAW